MYIKESNAPRYTHAAELNWTNTHAKFLKLK